MASHEATIDVLERWTGSGASWKAVHVSDALAIIDLCTCCREPVDRVQTSDPATIAYVRLRIAEE